MPLTQPLDRLELLDAKDLPELCCQCFRESSSMVGGATSAISNATKMLCGLGMFGALPWFSNAGT
jgi:hypothetical protein